MTFPWEEKPPEPLPQINALFIPKRPELVKDPVTGLYPGQQDPSDIPDFLRGKKDA